ncbi:AglZ/HisF2 family acetamidino modification protein [Aliarcobacter butzleri]|uniref:AglZ/HisF2 family acetamidino modification protein n=1 Tax=Aliarcobacter butzleri TaxID=28197 RepID=UPI0028750077|nr:AglZ/HisF2 family acetamidino modification protein [Aliarcobacter butzleri]MDS1369873.1 AglZ/HisF2 family acetamidino modification protein [Aliarcobacter butzleri]
MLRYRIIPTLLLHDKGLYKTVKYSIKKGKYVGDPINAIKIFNDKCVDELIFLDIDASKKKRGPDFKILQDIATECFMPVSYGGGITTLEEIKKIFQIGIEKVVLNTILLEDMSLLKKASKSFGSQSIVASVDIKKNFFGKYRIYDSSKEKNTSLDISKYFKDLELNGAGEIYISSVDRDGTFEGYDIELIKNISKDIKVPVIINGGARNINDFSKAIEEAGVSGVSAGSMFVFNGPHKAILITYPEYKKLENELGKN